MTRALVLFCLVLAGCGADGPPVPPSQAAAKPGLTVSGQVGIGVVGR